MPLKKSHIIPEFIYRSLYDDKHRFMKIALDTDKKFTYQQKGLREYLLCDSCEQLLSKHERYASLVLNGGAELTIEQKGAHIHLQGIQYASFKLFALSILWRASISNNSTFNQVTLGPHEDKIRQMILNESPGKESEYPFILSPIMHDDIVQTALIIQPTWTRIDKHFTYRFVFGGIAWLFVVSSHTPPSYFIDASIRISNELTMIPWEMSEMPFIIRMAEELSKQGKV